MSRITARQLAAELLEYADSGEFAPEEDFSPDARAKSAKQVKFNPKHFTGKRGFDGMPEDDDKTESPAAEEEKPKIHPRFKWRPPNTPGA